MVPNFSGWATVAGVKCADGRTIMKDAFKHQDKVRVPLMWQHQDDSPENVLGYAILEHREQGVYTQAWFNETPAGQNARALVEHGDITNLSIRANNLVEKNKNVMHGNIREVSLVLAGANIGAFIDNVNLEHGESDDQPIEEAIIYTGQPLSLSHAEDDSNDETVQDVYDSMNDKQKNVVAFLVGEALESVQHSDDSDDITGDASGDDQNDDDATGDDDNIEHSNQKGTIVTNVFDRTDENRAGGGTHLSHAQLMTIVGDAKKSGSFKEAFLAHADEYGITNIEMLFPDATLVQNTPEWITRRMEWVGPVLNGARHLPYSRIKTRTADLTHEEARAKGYIKGNLKKEQFFAIAQRETTPKTIYKKQKLDRDDIIDITDFDIVAWIWQEMRFMLNEEIARAILVGDGREVDDEDKIDETKIRPIAFDDQFYTDVVVIPNATTAADTVDLIIRGRDKYLGAGDPTAFMTRATYNDFLLIKDGQQRRLYNNRADVAAALEASSIVLVPILEGVKTDDGDLLVIFVNMSDYAIGTDKGGQITTFDDFDIDYNQYKYLIEGRLSGALISHKTAQVIVRGPATAQTKVTPTAPTFVVATGVTTIPTKTGVVYKDGAGTTLTAGPQAAIASGATIEIVASPAAGYVFPHGTDEDWSFTRA